MATVELLGATYQDVPAVQLPSTGGTVVMFYDALDGDSMSFGAEPLVGYAIVGQSALCEEE